MEYKLSELFDLQMGRTPSRNNHIYWNTGDNKWISIGDLSESNIYITETKEHISDLAVRESGIKAIPENTVVMSFKLSIGKTAITTQDMYSNEAIMAFIDKKVTTVLPEYLYYLLSGQDWDKGTNNAVMGKTLNKATLSERKIHIHSPEEQKKIVDILNDIKQIIDKYKNQLNKLETLIKARFVEMFGEPLSNSKGWQTMSIAEVAPIKSRRGELIDEIWLLNLDAVEAQTGTVLFKHRVQREEINASTVYFTTENVLYSKLRPYLNKVVMPDEDGVATSEMIPMYPLADRLTRSYLCYWLRSDAFVKHISEKVAGAKMPRVSMDYFQSLTIELPPLDLQEQFATFVVQVDKSKSAIQKSLEKTQLLFDSLMQEYFG